MNPETGKIQGGTNLTIPYEMAQGRANRECPPQHAYTSNMSLVEVAKAARALVNVSLELSRANIDDTNIKSRLYDILSARPSEKPRRGRPRGSRNAPKTDNPVPPRKTRGRKAHGRKASRSK